MSGFYRTDPTNPAGITARVGVSGSVSGMQVLEDGRSFVDIAHNTLANTNGEWMRFSFDFIAPDTTIRCRCYIECATSTGTGKVWFDGIKLQRIWRYEEYDARLSYDSLPVISEGRRDIFFQRWFTGQGSLTILNGNGYDPALYGRLLDELFGAYDFTSAPVHLRIGGRYPGGNEILTDDQWFRRWIARRPRLTPIRANLELEAPNTILGEQLPRRTYDASSFPNIYVNDEGRSAHSSLAPCGTCGLRA